MPQKNNDKTVEIEVELPEDLIERVEKICKQRGITFNDFALEAVRNFIKHHKTSK